MLVLLTLQADILCIWRQVSQHKYKIPFLQFEWPIPFSLRSASHYHRTPDELIGQNRDHFWTAFFFSMFFFHSYFIVLLFCYFLIHSLLYSHVSHVIAHICFVISLSVYIAVPLQSCCLLWNVKFKYKHFVYIWHLRVVVGRIAVVLFCCLYCWGLFKLQSRESGSRTAKVGPLGQLLSGLLSKYI